ncbi:MAG: hypothetical protein EPO51_08025 [Phenylobacterium sp.]|uniref:hypothetical protein n=1 Tax=Phenylobacterium sp. TaxID=1871053 RepID=UPI001210BEBA|nr:hypothetical protein [Phenylobacterium sp.]TAJ72710.1 MAG: hypothetical protein EPO51_08025 [Phenylobacterium sp.]
MSDLTEVELRTLQALAQKNAGQDVGFVNIAAARTLVDLGMASRSHEGWDITPRGSSELARRGGPPN